MTITVELPPETEAIFLAQARARGLTLDAFVKTIITNQVAVGERLTLLVPHEEEEGDRAIDELFDTVEVPPGVAKKRSVVRTGTDDCSRYRRARWRHSDF